MDNLPFKNGFRDGIDRKFVSKGLILKETEGKLITLKGLKEQDIFEIREILNNEIKRQNEEEYDNHNSV